MEEMRHFTSSNISAAKYNTRTQELVVYFRAGTTYSYSGVPAEVWQGLTEAPSAGSYFHANIRNGGYPYERIV